MPSRISVILITLSIMTHTKALGQSSVTKQSQDQGPQVNLYRLALLPGKIYGIGKCVNQSARDNAGSHKVTTCLYKICLSAPNKPKTILFTDDIELTEHWYMAGNNLYWVWDVPPQSHKSVRQLCRTVLDDNSQGHFIGPFPECFVTRMRPVEKLYRHSAIKETGSVFYDFHVINKSRLVCCIYYGNVMRVWSLDFNGEWKEANRFDVQMSVPFYLLDSDSLKFITAQGHLFQLMEEEVKQPVALWSTPESKTNMARSKSVQSFLLCRLLLLEHQDKEKYVLFQWANKELTPLDVLDKEKQNIEPFLPAKDVDPKIIKAATVMLKQMQKDEQEVAEFRKELEAKKKAQAEEDAKKPQSQTLQERLQQN